MGEYDLSVRPLASLNSDLRFQPCKIAGSEGMQVREKRESNPRERNVRIQNECTHLRSLDEYALHVACSACHAHATGPLPARAALPLPRRRTPPCSCSLTAPAPLGPSPPVTALPRRARPLCATLPCAAPLEPPPCWTPPCLAASLYSLRLPRRPTPLAPLAVPA